jgi:hypothetical protein
MPLAPLAHKHVVVELARPTCGPSTYALLGGQFEPNPTEELRIEAAVAVSPGPSASWAMPPFPNHTQIGLPKHYAEAAVEAAVDEATNVAVGGVVLRCDRAVEDQVGSSEWMFKVVARGVVHLLALQSPTDDEIADIFRELLRHGVTG